MSSQTGWGGQAPPGPTPADGAPSSWPGAPPGAPPLEEAPNGLLSMILGILGIVAFPVVPSIFAIVLGRQAQRTAQEQPYRYKDSFSKVGVITGWVGLALAAIGLLLVFVFFGIFALATTVGGG